MWQEILPWLSLRISMQSIPVPDKDCEIDSRLNNYKCICGPVKLHSPTHMIYWSVLIKRGKWAVIYIFVRYIYLTSVSNIFQLDLVFYVPHFISLFDKFLSYFRQFSGSFWVLWFHWLISISTSKCYCKMYVSMSTVFWWWFWY